MTVLMENHQEFIHVMKSRKTKLEVINIIAVRSVTPTDVRQLFYVYPVS
jgi:hypothetical protein